MNGFESGLILTIIFLVPLALALKKFSQEAVFSAILALIVAISVLSGTIDTNKIHHNNGQLGPTDPH